MVGAPSQLAEPLDDQADTRESHDLAGDNRLVDLEQAWLLFFSLARFLKFPVADQLQFMDDLHSFRVEIDVFVGIIETTITK